MRLVLEFINDGRNRKPDGTVVYWAEFGQFKRDGVPVPEQSATVKVSSKGKMHYNPDVLY